MIDIQTNSSVNLMANIQDVILSSLELPPWMTDLLLIIAALGGIAILYRVWRWWRKPSFFVDFRTEPDGSFDTMAEVVSDTEIDFTIRVWPKLYLHRIERITIGFVGEKADDGQAEIISGLDPLFEGDNEIGKISRYNNIQITFDGKPFPREKNEPLHISLSKLLRNILPFVNSNGRFTILDFKKRQLYGETLWTGFRAILPQGEHTLRVTVTTAEGRDRHKFPICSVTVD